MLELASAFAAEQTCVAAMCILGATGVLVSSVEYIAERRTFQQAGLLDWHVCKLASKLTCAGPTEELLDAVFSESGFVALMLLRILVSVLLCLSVTGTGTASGYCSVVLLLLLLTFNVRHVFGRDGSDQMLVIVFAGLSAYFFLSERFRLYALLFVALQLTLSYIVAGYAKLASPVWRQGEAIVGVLGTRCYGAPRECRPLVFRLLPRVSKLMCWSVILFECSFPVLWFAPTSVAIAVLSVGVLFHVGVALLMGLNVFLWAFLASYPAVLLCHSALRSAHS